MRVLELVNDTGKHCVLYDALEMEAPPVEVAWSQRKLDAELGGPKLRRAIVVPNRRLAYLARLAFGDGDHRVFYSDMLSAVTWLDLVGIYKRTNAADAAAICLDAHRTLGWRATA